MNSKLLLVLFVFIAPLALGGCDQLRGKLSEISNSQSAGDALVAAKAKLKAGDFEGAVVQAQYFADKPGDSQEEFAFVVAQASANMGEAVQTLQYLGIAMKIGWVGPEAVMLNPAFEALHQDSRFLALLATGPIKPANVGSHTLSSVINSQNDASTSIRMDDQVIEVKTGSVSVTLQK